MLEDTSLLRLDCFQLSTLMLDGSRDGPHLLD